jgi:hypothetical protein
MTSYVIQIDNPKINDFASAYQCAKQEAMLKYVRLISVEVEPSRLKIECPPYPEAIENSLYMEAHFPYNGTQYATSKRIDKEEILGTDRTYDKSQYQGFQKKWNGHDVEVAVYDTNVEQDDEWMGLFSYSRSK